MATLGEMMADKNRRAAVEAAAKAEAGKVAAGKKEAVENSEYIAAIEQIELKYGVTIDRKALEELIRNTEDFQSVVFNDAQKLEIAESVARGLAEDAAAKTGAGLTEKERLEVGKKFLKVSLEEEMKKQAAIAEVARESLGGFRPAVRFEAERDFSKNPLTTEEAQEAILSLYRPSRKVELRSETAPAQGEMILIAEATLKLNQLKFKLADLRFKKAANGSLSSEELKELEWALREIQKILTTPENFKTKEKPISSTAPTENREVLAPGESFEVFTNDNGKFISIKRGRKIMIVDYSSAEPKPGSRTKVRIIRDTAPGERRGALIVEVVPDKKPAIEKEVDRELNGLVLELRGNLAFSLESHFKLHGVNETFPINSIELPEGLTLEHLEAIKELYPGAFEPRILPTNEDLHNLDDSYVSVMFPETQRPEDKDNGLISFRPNWWNEPANAWGFGIFNKTTNKGDAYIASMRTELQSIGGSLVLLDTAIKPNYIDGSQQYGSIDGTDDTKDKLLPLFQEVFGTNTNRFNNSWDNIMIVAARLKEKIKAKFTTLGLPSVDFDVMLIPAVLENIELTTINKTSSDTDTWEWTSTPLVDDTGADTVHRIHTGNFGNGGASDMGSDVRSILVSSLGARLAIVFKKK